MIQKKTDGLLIVNCDVFVPSKINILGAHAEIINKMIACFSPKNIIVIGNLDKKSTLQLPNPVYSLKRSPKEKESCFDNPLLLSRLQKNNIKRLYIVGYDANHCIKTTAVDAVNHAFETVVVENACAGQDTPPGAFKHSFSEIRQGGATVLNYD